MTRRHRRRRRPHPLAVVATFSNDGDHLQGARVFNKPVKARPRICLPSAFVTLLVLWLESGPTWKKGSRWYPSKQSMYVPYQHDARLYRRPYLPQRGEERGGGKQAAQWRIQICQPKVRFTLWRGNFIV